MAHATHWVFTLYISSALAAYSGFNYGSTFINGTARQYGDFLNLFNSAQNLAGASGFSSARLYTTLQAGTVNTPISAIQAAIDTGSSLLLGLWTTDDEALFANEITALKNVIYTNDTRLEDLVVGISVGSEDLYRVSSSTAGADAGKLVNYIQQTRDAVAGTPLSAVPIGHVDTWGQWVNASNAAVIDASDFVGFDAYPYYQSNDTNSIDQASDLFWAAMNATTAAVGSKPVWVTETGWPLSGPVEGLAVPSLTNAQIYWQTVGCALFGSINTWWYLLQDDTAGAASFGVVGPGFYVVMVSFPTVFILALTALAVMEKGFHLRKRACSPDTCDEFDAYAELSTTSSKSGETLRVTTYPTTTVSSLNLDSISTLQPISEISDGQIQAPAATTDNSAFPSGTDEWPCLEFGVGC